MRAIFGGENPCIEWRTIIARVRTVASRVVLHRRLTEWLSLTGSSRTRSMGEGMPPPGKYYRFKGETRLPVSALGDVSCVRRL